MRGRLIFPIIAEIFQIKSRDGNLFQNGSKGFDDDFREPSLLDANVDGLAEHTRLEAAPLYLPCQVEIVTSEQERGTALGSANRSELTLVFHVRDLEQQNLVDPNSGEIWLHIGDRLARLQDGRGNWTACTAHGLFATELKRTSYGLGQGQPSANLLLIKFQDRQPVVGRA